MISSLKPGYAAQISHHSCSQISIEQMDAKNLRRLCYRLKQVVLASVATKVIDAIYVVAWLQALR
jgi:hypothetical protein